jgi:hypothetical protein
MKSTLLTLAALFAFATPAQAETVSLSPVADTYTDAANPNVNHGSDPVLKVSNDAAKYRSYLKFDLSSLPASATVTGVAFRAYTSSPTGRYTINRATNLFDEGTLTAATRTPFFDPDLGSVGWSSTGYKAVNLPVSSLTNQHGRNSYGLWTPDSEARTFDSRQGARRPQLDVTYTTPQSSPPPPPTGTLLWNQTWEPGSSPAGYQCLSTRHTTVQSPVFEGANAQRFEVRPGDVEPSTGSSRCEWTTSGRYDPTPPVELWVRYAVYVPSSTVLQNLSWLAIFQYKEHTDVGPPPLETFLDYTTSGKGRFRIASGDSRVNCWSSAEIQRDRWYDVNTFVRLDPDPAKGFVEVYLNGAPQAMRNGTGRCYLKTAVSGARAYFKGGVYRDPRHTVTSTVFEDGVRIGSTRSVVGG